MRKDIADFLALIICVAAFSSSAQAEGDRLFSWIVDGEKRATNRIKQLENSLKGVFASNCGVSAEELTGDVKIVGGQRIAAATLIAGVWVMPAHKTLAQKVEIHSWAGQKIAGGVPKLLSKVDNLAYLPASKRVEWKRHASLNNGYYIAFCSGVGCDWKVGAITSLPGEVLAPPKGVVKSLQQHWKNLGLQVSEIRSGYPCALITDMRINPGQEGIGAFSIGGELVGVAIARNDVHSSLVIPVARITKLLSQINW